MPMTLPRPGYWYQLPDGDTFRVTSIDELDEHIEIQHTDGALEIFDVDLWKNLAAFEMDADESLAQPLSDPEELDFVTLGVAPGTEGATWAGEPEYGF